MSASPSHHDHPYHLVNPSPWPFAGSVAAFILAYGAVQYFQDHAHRLWLLVGLGLVLLTMLGWWRDVVREANSGHDHTAEVQHGLRVGMALFIASEVMFFAAFFWAFFNAALGVNQLVPEWPPAGIEPLHTWTLPFINTLILLSSGATVNWAHHGLREGNRTALKGGLALSVVLGALFLSLQVYEYGQATFGFQDGVYPSVFYMATGFHGFHVFVGVCFLAVCLARAVKGDFTPKQHVGFEAAAWYWHFVDVVWLFLFVWVYWWGNS
ncbi:cytochrome c oxidase subunit 3 [Magnetospirillum moscoviense]|uniref:cytochrome-c oxidase n=1 Tax=Magnetospirillum moscoviense TaxID=1437059 RepID=A0A178MX75_9PROT|nr:cytochrome c oxidase subunit 3 [Magnetospirillum moscoviense]OAN55702.1 cytochrome B562 [Magnetospirillum moscoviense]